MRARGSLAVVATHLRPAQGFGGVAECTSELITAWRRAGRRLVVTVSDGARGPALSLAAYEHELGAPVRLYHASLAVRWGFGWLAPLVIGRSIWSSERVYISGVATWPTTWAALLAQLLARPYVVALHGSLMPEHWREILRNRPLKTLFYRLFVFPALRGATAVHAASRLEADAARQAVPSARTFVAPNAFALPTIAEQALEPPPGPGIRLLYLGRLSPEKGILGFARRFAAVRGPDDRLLIAGPAEGEYGEDLVRLCQTDPGLEHLGVLSRDRLARTFAGVHAIVLPSGVDGPIKENFGNVVVEALSHGRPALATEGLAWDALEPAGVGFRLDRDLANLDSVLARLRALIAAGSVWSDCLAYARAHFAPEHAADIVWRAVFCGADGAGTAIG